MEDIKDLPQQVLNNVGGGDEAVRNNILDLLQRQEINFKHQGLRNLTPPPFSGYQHEDPENLPQQISGLHKVARHS